MKLKNVICLAALGILTSCNQATNTAGTKQDTIVKTSGIAISNQKIQSVYLEYIALKDALVNNDSTSAKDASIKLSSGLKAVAGCETTSKIADSISTASTIKAQRTHFALLSSELIPLVKHAPMQGGSIFVLHCPMANNGKGANWLASEKIIKNPYYGAEMLECGVVEEEIKAK